MKGFIKGTLAAAGCVYLTEIVACYILTTYKKEIREYVIEKVIDYFFTDEDGKEIDEGEILMQAIQAYLKKKGANE